MIRLVHLSDLHFGQNHPTLLQPLLDAVNGLAPDLVAVSGDLTERARTEQFRAAQRFLDQLAAPVIAVPGNHDVPLGNVAARAVSPWRRYRRFIAMAAEGELRHPGLHVVGVNTVDPWSWRRGRMPGRALRRVRAAFAAGDPACRVVLCHHPLEHPPGSDRALMRGARQAVPSLSRAGADVVLSGHLHRWRAAPVAAFGDILLVHSGSGLAAPELDDPNGFNLIEIDTPDLTVTRYVAGAGAGAFTAADRVPFVKQAGQWMQGPAAASPRRLARSHR